MLSNYFHVFVIFVTILFYLLLRKQNRKIDNKYSKLYLTIYIPFILYISYYLFFYNHSIFINNPNHPNTNSSMISDIYPSSIDI